MAVVWDKVCYRCDTFKLTLKDHTIDGHGIYLCDPCTRALKEWLTRRPKWRDKAST